MIFYTIAAITETLRRAFARDTNVADVQFFRVGAQSYPSHSLAEEARRRGFYY